MSHQQEVDQSYLIVQIHFARFSSYAKVIVTEPIRILWETTGNYDQFRYENQWETPLFIWKKKWRLLKSKV